MPTPSLSTETERRKQLRARLRPDLVIVPQRYEGRSCYVVKDPVALRYYRFEEQEHFLLTMMDGTRTLDEVRRAFEKRFPPERMKLEDLEGFVQRLLKEGLIHGTSLSAGTWLYEQRRKRRRMERLLTASNFLYAKIPLVDPDRFLTWLLRPLRWIFTTWFMLASTGLMLAALLLVATHFEAFRQRLPGVREFFDVRTIVALWITLGVVKVIHELAHGLTCKAFGGEIHEMGLLLLCFSPCLYCNVSDAWTLPSKWKRMAVGFAGIHVELVIAALATFVWWNAPDRPWLSHLCLCLMFLCSVSTVVFNANPLMRFDGYYVLADWLEIPNLRERSGQFLKDLVAAGCLGVEVEPQPPMASGRRVLFVLYAIASYVYFWVVMFGILWFLYTFLKPYKLGTVGALLAVLAIGSMVGWPLFRLGQGLRRRGRLPDMQSGRVAVTLAAIGLLILFVALVPLPLGDVRQVAVVQFLPEAEESVYVRVGGTLEHLHVRDGQHVEKGQLLAEFRSLDLETRLEEARSQHEILSVKAKTLAAEARGVQAPGERSRWHAALAAAQGERNLAARQIEVYERSQELLVLRAPRAGVVIAPPRPEQVGRRWDTDSSTPFCRLGDPGRLRALCAVSPNDYVLLQQELARQGELPAWIRVQGQGLRRWAGRLSQLPDTEARDVPLSLTSRGGGPLPVKPAAQGDRFMPQTQHYLVAIELVEPDRSLVPGSLAQVKVPGRWHSCAWWLWRTVTSTFEPQLF